MRSSESSSSSRVLAARTLALAPDTITSPGSACATRSAWNGRSASGARSSFRVARPITSRKIVSRSRFGKSAVEIRKGVQSGNFGEPGSFACMTPSITAEFFWKSGGPWLRSNETGCLRSNTRHLLTFGTGACLGKFGQTRGRENPRKSGFTSAHHEGVELVALGVAEIGGIEFLVALAGRAFATAAERQGELVDSVDLGLVPGAERGHHAIADRHRLAVKGERHAKAGATAPSAPGDDAVVGHQASHAELAANFVVEFADLFRLIGANHDVSDHDSSLNAFPNLGADPIEPVAAAILDSRARQPGLRRHRSIAVNATRPREPPTASCRSGGERRG